MVWFTNESQHVDLLYNKISGRELPSQVHVELKKVQRHLAQHFAVDCSANFEAFRVRPKKLTGLKNEETENESINNVNATMDPRKLLLHIICLETGQLEIQGELERWSSLVKVPYQGRASFKSSFKSSCRRLIVQWCSGV